MSESNWNYFVIQMDGDFHVLLVLSFLIII